MCLSYFEPIVIGDMCQSCVQSKSFFGLLGRLYTFFSESTKQWSILKKHITGLTVKPLCDTRWESHIDSVKVLRYQSMEVYEALLESSDDEQACSEAESLADGIKNFNFRVFVVMWYDLLYIV